MVAALSQELRERVKLSKTVRRGFQFTQKQFYSLSD